MPISPQAEDIESAAEAETQRTAAEELAWQQILLRLDSITKPLVARRADDEDNVPSV